MRRGPKTTEFWLTVGVSIIGGAAAIIGAIPAATAVTIAGALAGTYTIARGVIKALNPETPIEKVEKP